MEDATEVLMLELQWDEGWVDGDEYPPDSRAFSKSALCAARTLRRPAFAAL
jgi:hypothetical protein